MPETKKRKSTKDSNDGPSQTKRQTKKRTTYRNKESTRIYIGKLPEKFITIKDNLLELFNDAGIELELRGDKRNFCHATLVHPEDKSKMLALNGTTYLGSKLKINAADDLFVKHERRNGQPMYNRVAFKNCDPDSVQPEDLAKATGGFEPYILESKRIGFVSFTTPLEAQNVCHQRRITINDCTMILNMAIPKGKIKEEDLPKNLQQSSRGRGGGRGGGHLGRDHKQGYTNKGGAEPSASRDKKRHCFNCGERGHFSRECPTSPGSNCLNCGEAGHHVDACTVPLKCHHCKQLGHKSYSCPEKPVSCKNCSESGHRANDCTKPKYCYNCLTFSGHLSKDCPSKGPAGVALG